MNGIIFPCQNKIGTFSWTFLNILKEKFSVSVEIKARVTATRIMKISICSQHLVLIHIFIEVHFWFIMMIRSEEAHSLVTTIRKIST